jgi:tripeptide aminopeptidase
MDTPGEIRQAVVFDSHLRPGHYISRGYGSMKFAAEIHGRSAHAGLAPETGVNAILIAARALADLPWGWLDETATANAGLIEGGSGENVVPERALVRGEVRSLGQERLSGRIGIIEEAFRTRAGEAGGELTFETNWNFRGYEHGEEDEVTRTVTGALRACGLEPKPATSAGGSDANELNARGLPTINIGIGAQNPHAHDEFILLEDLQAAADIARAVMRGR